MCAEAGFHCSCGWQTSLFKIYNVPRTYHAACLSFVEKSHDLSLSPSCGVMLARRWADLSLGVGRFDPISHCAANICRQTQLKVCSSQKKFRRDDELPEQQYPVLVRKILLRGEVPCVVCEVITRGRVDPGASAMSWALANGPELSRKKRTLKVGTRESNPTEKLRL